MSTLGRPPREEKADRAPIEPPQGERERTRRRRVEPLNVVDGDQDRSAFAQKLQDVAHCNGKRAVIDRITRRLLLEKRHLERVPSRRQERRERVVVYDILEQIHEPNVSEGMLRLGRTRRQDR